ncbi:PREDICTED: uncharacterized protein LOC106323669 [Brassica oleracea var. oleracea]|uniref:uncharacterized protein LOC106323669 n=1 Tax=Brassica oleracea var. oleracea TaxID=109376 RepID=UPI0006A6F2F0|nr:PREDICTED: uncharacterized protein LOC106323669 [Brassica oleracea var. oleracea]
MWRTSSKWITTISYRLRRLERPSGITLPSTMSRPWSAQEFSRTRSCCNHIIIAYNVLLVVANGQLHVSAPGKRFDRYPELVQEAFGPRLGYWIVLPQQLLVQIASDLVYSGVEATPLVGHVLVQYWRCDFERKTKDEGDEEDGGFREKESRCSHRGRISYVAFVTEKSSESFVDDQFPWLSSTKNLGGVARRRISVAMSVGESLWLSSTEEIGGSPLQTISSVGAKLNRKLFPHMASKNHRD